MLPERQCIQEVFHKACSNYKKWTVQSPEVKTQQIIWLERGCLNASIIHAHEINQIPNFSNVVFIEYYSALCAKVLANIDCTSTVQSTYLCDLMIAGENPMGFATMTSKDLCPAASATERNEIWTRQEQKLIENKSILHRCKCGSRSIDMEEHQTRAADELPTHVATCKDCGRFWRI
jgi:DNA-directed RNA polymerase subunit M/transcription elongation factor TFIIS